MVGQQFGKWTVVNDVFGRTNDGHKTVLCRCLCGVERFVSYRHLQHGSSKSCGCQGGKIVFHGKTDTPTYRSWVAMMTRCYNSKRREYHRYGGRGIVVCQRWHTFQYFFEDIGERPDGCSLERIDNDRHYEPGNVRWATQKEQARNTVRNRYVVLHGVRRVLSDVAVESGIAIETMRNRLASGMSVEDSISRPVMNNRPSTLLIEWHGEKKTISGWADALGMRRDTLAFRMKHCPLEKGFSAPLRAHMSYKRATE